MLKKRPGWMVMMGLQQDSRDVSIWDLHKKQAVYLLGVFSNPLPSSLSSHVE